MIHDCFPVFGTAIIDKNESLFCRFISSQHVEQRAVWKPEKQEVQWYSKEIIG